MRQRDHRGTEHSNLAERRSARHGFTIVELLIVIVVIGILAAIALVAYNGIQNRARASAASSALSQAAKKISIWQVDNPGSAPSCASFFTLIGSTETSCVASVGDTEYQYKVGTSGSYYCITATVGATSWRVAPGAAPSSGACAGHGSGGVASISNLILSPGFEDDAHINGGNVGPSGGTRSVRSTDAQSGNKHVRLNFTTSNIGWGQFTSTVQPGQYFASYWIRVSKPLAFNPYLQGSSVRGAATSSPANGTVIQANAWTKVTHAFTVTGAGTVQVGGYVSNNPTWTTSDYLDMDSFMMTPGSTDYSYADGSSPGWDWNGTPNSSTSAGPPL